MPSAGLPPTSAPARWRAQARSVAGRFSRAPFPGGDRGALIALGFLARLLWVLAVPSRPVGDFALYRESAAYLVEHHALDPQFIYMPGYVFLLGAVEWLGGGLLAAKMIGVAAGTAMVAAAGGIAEGLWTRRVGLVAAALAALWPAGIAVTSVTGTDLPAGALVALALWALVRWSRERPWRAAIVFGLLMGLGAWVRAVAAPLAGLSFFYWWAVERRAPRAFSRAVLGMAVAFTVLLPWALRNHALYGELFFTDSHGGHTALVGANPDSEGTYSRSLNLMFTSGTGYRLLNDGPERHRASDRAAYELAKSWSAFEPAYALGLLAAKADRLLSHERNLLYWPIYRQGVLAPDARAFLDAHRSALERACDGFWWGIVGLFVAGVVLAVPARDRRPLALLVFPSAMVVIYASFFSEVRYHLAIAPLLFPLAALALCWAVDARKRRFRGDARAGFGIGVAVLLVFALWATLVAAGAALRARTRWAVTVCSYPTAAETHLCNWQRHLPAQGPSPVRGTWDGVGLRIGQVTAEAADVAASAVTTLMLDGGRYRVRATVAVVGAGAGPEVVVAVTAGQSTVARALVRRTPDAVPSGVPEQSANAEKNIEGIFDHEGGPLALELNVEPGAVGSIPDGATVWFSQLVVERFAPSVIIPRR